MLHQHRHHHVDEDKLRREHEGHKVQGRDELEARVAVIVHLGVVVGWALAQRVLGEDGEEGSQGQTGGSAGKQTFLFIHDLKNSPQLQDLELKS